MTGDYHPWGRGKAANDTSGLAPTTGRSNDASLLRLLQVSPAQPIAWFPNRH
jgi:hypothetical protein